MGRRLMLDSNALLWWIDEDGPLRADVRAMLDDVDNEVVVSAASILELRAKEVKGRLRLPPHLLPQLDVMEVDVLDITGVHAEGAAALPPLHGDPFDRLIVAQALADDYVLVTSDRLLPDYGVPVLAAR